MILCASFVGLALPMGAQAQQEPQIHFINPSDFSEDGQMPIISDRSVGDDGEEGEGGRLYRLNAWTRNAPLNPIVEFETQVGINSVTIGTATEVTPNVFEFQWDLSGVPIDGTYPLRAILFSGSGTLAQEVARDEVQVLITTGRTPQGESDESKAPAADFSYPTNGGQAGFYTNPTDGQSGIIEDHEFSAGTTHVGLYYTVSQVGDEPSWKLCGSEAPSAGDSPGSDRDGCTIESIDRGAVTAMAVVANDNPDIVFGVFNEDFNQAGDAVSVLPYEQDGSSITIDIPTVRENSSGGSFPCSDTMTVVPLDQFGRPMPHAPIDVHARGPSDQLKFGITLSFFGSQHDPPDKGHAGVEPQFDCVEPDNRVVPDQGDHNIPGEPDIKHVEDPSDTDDDGDFSFRLHADRAGQTQITVWIDEDDDDFFCSEEPAVGATIGWDEDPSAPVTESPTTADCPIPEPPQMDQEPECSDGVDNDGDGKTDFGEDPGCDSPQDDDETDEDGDPRGCTISGDDGPNTLEGTDGNDVICGNGGDDTIDGRGGNDVIFGDDGDDDVTGGPGDDTIHGGAGRDTLRGASGNDNVMGNADNDTLLGGGGADTLRGNRGTDTLRGGGASDDLRGGVAADVLTGGRGGDSLRGGRGIDTLKGRQGADVLRGGRHNDNLRGGGGPDTLNGGAGTDTCRGGRGRDRTANCER